MAEAEGWSHPEDAQVPCFLRRVAAGALPPAQGFAEAVLMVGNGPTSGAFHPESQRKTRNGGEGRNPDLPCEGTTITVVNASTSDKKRSLGPLAAGSGEAVAAVAARWPRRFAQPRAHPRTRLVKRPVALGGVVGGCSEQRCSPVPSSRWWGPGDGEPGRSFVCRSGVRLCYKPVSNPAGLQLQK